MEFTVPPDLEAMVQRRLASGAYSTVEEVFRSALESLEDDELWSQEEREALDAKIDRALEQVATGRTYSRDEALQRLAAVRSKYLTAKA